MAFKSERLIRLPFFTRNNYRKVPLVASRQNAMSRDLKQLSTRVSLVILALGFSFLGALTLIYRAQGNWPVGPDLENDYYCLGSAASFFAGLIFLAAACTYWKR
jgi:hypothetical protein